MKILCSFKIYVWYDFADSEVCRIDARACKDLQTTLYFYVFIENMLSANFWQKGHRY